MELNELFYERLVNYTNSWFLNNHKLIKNHTHTISDEKLNKLVSIVGNHINGTLIVAEEQNAPATELSRQIKKDYTLMCNYTHFKVIIDDLDFMRCKTVYTIIIGVTDFPGCTSSARYRAYMKLQELFMKEGLGALNKDVKDKLEEIKLPLIYEELNVKPYFSIY